MKRQILLPLLALLLATQTGCSILSGNNVSVPVASNNGNNNGSQNGSYNTASAAAAPTPVPIGVTRLADPTAPMTGNATPVILPASVSLNRVSTELASMNLPQTESGAVDLQSIYYGGDVKAAVTMPSAAPVVKPQASAAVSEASEGTKGVR